MSLVAIACMRFLSRSMIISPLFATFDLLPFRLCAGGCVQDASCSNVATPSVSRRQCRSKRRQRSLLASRQALVFVLIQPHRGPERYAESRRCETTPCNPMRSAVARSSAVMEAIREAQLAVTGTHYEDHEKSPCALQAAARARPCRRVFEWCKSSSVATGTRQAFYEARTNRFRHIHDHNGAGATCLSKGPTVALPGPRITSGASCSQLPSMVADAVRIARAPARHDLHF